MSVSLYEQKNPSILEDKPFSAMQNLVVKTKSFTPLGIEKAKFCLYAGGLWSFCASNPHSMFILAVPECSS